MDIQKVKLSKGAKIGLIIFTILFAASLILLIYFVYKSESYQAVNFAAGMPKLANRKATRKKPTRPPHEKWYNDIPENHPEVLDLVKVTKEQSNRVPKYTKEGFKHIRTPKHIQKYLHEIALTQDRVPEGKNNIFSRTSSGNPPYLIPIPESKRKWIHEQLKPIMEEWSGLELEPTSAYGPREYVRGSSLRMHVDTESTHIISGILHIHRENMDTDWPLVIINRQGQRQDVFMKPGDLVLYESASLPHSREKPLQGDYYVNMFIHYQPKNYHEHQKRVEELQQKEYEPTHHRLA